MDERATSEDFVPFVPRRITLQARTAPSPEAFAPVEPQPDAPRATPPQPADNAADAFSCASESALETRVAGEASECAQTDALEAAAIMASLTPLQRPTCNHEDAIRNQAIRLAIVACGRALRHVALVHPKLVAGFVDDAMAAAGNPKCATIITESDGRALGVGEVLVDCDGCQIRADLQTRAELLVRAAADA